MKGSRTLQQPDGPVLTPVNAVNEHVFTNDREDDRETLFLEYWRIVKRFRWSILAIGFVAGVIGMLSALSATSLYRADSRLLVEYNQLNFARMQQFESMPLHWLFYQTQADIILSRAIAERVADRLGLAEVPNDESGGGDSASQTRKGFAERVQGWLTEVKSWLPEEFRPPVAPPMDADLRRAALVNSLLGSMSVSGGQDSEVLVVSAVSSDPKLAANMANTFAEAYIEFGLESRTRNVRQATSWLGQRIEELRTKVVESENALRQFQAREDLVDTQNQERIISAKLGTLTAELIKAQSRRGEAEARNNQAGRLVQNQNSDESLATIINSPTLVEAHHAKIAQEHRVAELTERYGHKHPKMIAAQTEFAEAKRRLKLEIDKAMKNIRKELDLAKAQELRLHELIAQQQSEMRKVSGKSFQLKQLERDVETNRDLYQMYLARFKEADVVDEYDVPDAKIIDRAIIPTTPFKPNRKRMVMISVVLGLGVGVALAFLRNHLDNTFKTKEDVENKLNLPVIGMIPKIRSKPLNKNSSERLVLNEPRSPFAEAINDVRTAILFSRIDSPPKVVLITSPVPGEGKTNLALNLAMAFARRGRTLLVDADLRKGRLGSVLDLDDRPGLSDLLSGQCTTEEAIVADTDEGNLFLLTSGTIPPNPLEVVSSNRFSNTVDGLKNSFEHIVVDGTPLLPVSDSIVLSRIADVTVMVIKSDDTPKDAALEAVKRMQASRVKPVGVILQQVDMRKLKSYGRRYVGNYYKGYYGYQKPRRV